MSCPEKGRLFAIDWLRGLMLILLTVNHIEANPGKGLTFESLGFFGAAEGFVFLSGILAGYVYSKIPSTGGVLREKLLCRAMLIGSCWMGLIVGVPLLAHTFGGLPFAALTADSFRFPLRLGYGEVLGLYFVLFLAAYPILTLLQKGRSGVLFGVSVALYLVSWVPASAAKLAIVFGEWTEPVVRVAMFLRGSVPSPWGRVYEGYEWIGFSVLSWQFLFVIAITLGHRAQKGTLPGLLRSPKLIWVTGAICLGIFLLKHFGDASGVVPELFLKKEFLGIVRLFSFLVFSLLVYGALIRLRTKSRIRGLELLGRNSLSVYVFQVLLVFGVINSRLAEGVHVAVAAAVVLTCVISLFPAAGWFEHCSARLRKLGRALGKSLGLPGKLDWKRRAALTLASAYLVINGVNLINLREDFPLTSASMFARYIDRETQLYSVDLYKRAIDEKNALRFSDYGLNRRILLYSIYCSDEECSPYYNPGCAEEGFSRRIELWFVQLHRRYIEQHGEDPGLFLLVLSPVNEGLEPIVMARYSTDLGLVSFDETIERTPR
ncbi:OpgC domain-containing protein [Pelagicoccus sp. SDUM812002]|uniref:OpgC domain-containing protein n=1 Tax=Pelagicoccus sp. SDUM812002 TaxID=3041266 RepID=UPI00280EF462|nr:OpgC domain-containing protein [Pelagicoccus sp. SDUM812002]MDQ8184002.1 OpgC domain-containing protein [Pelagicoccus sp. SDUM812002]